MTKIRYSYEIISVNPDAKAMEIVYTHPTYGKTHVGARMPFEGETIRDIVRMFNPTRYWQEQNDLVTVPVEVGATGEEEEDLGIDPIIPTLDKVSLIRAMRDIDVDQRNLWQHFKQRLARADEETREDFEYVTVIRKDDELLLAVLATIAPNRVDEIINTIFGVS